MPRIGLSITTSPGMSSTTRPMTVRRSNSIGGLNMHRSSTTPTRMSFPASPTTTRYPIASHSLAHTPRTLRSILLNPLFIPPSHPLLRLLSCLLVYFITISTILSHLPNKPYNPVSIFHPRPPSLQPLPPWDPPDRPLDHLPSPDARWRALLPLPPPPAPWPRLLPQTRLPDEVLEQWLVDGECTAPQSVLGPEIMLDATWLWVNGSDPRWKKTLWENREKQGIISPDHHWRENNELIYSLRSVLAALPGKLRTFHLSLADSEFNSDTDLGLLPPGAVEYYSGLAGKGKETSPRAEREPKRYTVTEDRVIMHPVESGSETSLLKAAPHPRAGGPYRGTSELRSIPARVLDWMDRNLRVAQVPTWLAFERTDLGRGDHPMHAFAVPKDGKVKGKGRGKGGLMTAKTKPETYPSLRYATHSEIFRLPSTGAGREGEGGEEEGGWKEETVPTYNSMAIEQKQAWLPGLGEVYLVMNDDHFTLIRHAVSDFYSLFYGTVVRWDHGWYQQVKPKLDPSYLQDPGEVGGLLHANYLLSQRFPRRMRPYFAHVPKTLTRNIAMETSLMFESALTVSATRRFRELKIGNGDIQFQWLATSLNVERWREALLWTYCVARVGTASSWLNGPSHPLVQPGDEGWGEASRTEIKSLFGLNDDDTDVVMIEVHRGERWTLERDRVSGVFENTGWERPKNTEFLWSSLDGHVPPIIAPGTAPDQNDKCIFDLERCFGPWWIRNENVTSDAMFKRLAFVNPGCGDCLITALITASGPLGLSAFFPPPHTTYTLPLNAEPGKLGYRAPEHLPLVPTWQEAEFGLQSVLRETNTAGESVDLRKWSMRLLSRYLFMSGKSRSHFHMLKDPEHAHRVFAMIDADPAVDLLGMNDDIERGYEETRRIMGEWFEKRWPEKAPWEMGWKD